MDEDLTPKQQYEKRKAERKRQKDTFEKGPKDWEATKKREDLMAEDMLNLFDRFVTAVESIADTMKKGKP